MFIFSEIFNNGVGHISMYVVSLTSILSALSVIVTNNPIVSVLYLIGLFVSVAIYLMNMGIGFIGLSYLLVYVGAVSILFLFILMLINVRTSELTSNNSNSIFLAIIVGVTLNTFLSIILPNIKRSSYNLYDFILTINLLDIKHINLNSYIYNVTSSIWDKNLLELSHITTIGSVMYIVYPLWLIITSLILLLGMVGAIIITMK
jgi:NADH-ubiquinone oxidoreductase chain 6